MQHFSKRQKEIIDKSINIIDQKGIQNFTIKNISNSIGISEPAIYRHFDSKMDILLAILSIFKDSEKNLVSDKKFQKKNSIEKIKAIYDSHFKKFKKTPTITSVIFSEEIFQNEIRLSELVYEIMKTNHNFIIKIVGKGQKDNEIRSDIDKEQITIMIMGTLRFIVKKWHMSNYKFDLESEGRKLWKAIDKILR